MTAAAPAHALNDPRSQEHIGAAIQAEQAVLGACLLDETACDTALGLMKTEDFTRNPHRYIFDAIKNLQQAGKPADSVTVMDYLAAKNELERIGGPVYLAELSQAVASTANVEAYIRIITDAARKRTLASTCRLILQEMDANPALSPDEIGDRASALILESTEDRSASRPVSSSDVMMEVLNRITAYEKTRGIIQMETGLRGLDAIIRGLHPGQLTVVAGRPGSGKTTLALQMAAHVALVHKKPVAFFSLEMEVEILLLKMLSQTAMVNFGSILTGTMPSHEKDRVRDSASHLAGSSLYFTGPGNTDMNSVAANLRRLVHQKGVALAMVDYLQLLPAGRRFDTRNEEVGYVSGRLKALASQLKIPIIAAAQLNREVTKGAGAGSSPSRKPRLSDLRDSGSIEQDADNVIMIHQADAFEDEAGNREAELIVAKQRLGVTGEVQVAFQGRFSRFSDVRTAPSTPEAHHA